MNSSVFSSGHAQRDGRRYVTETHTDDAGGVHRVEYLAAVGTDYTAVMQARAAQIDAALLEAEIAEVIGGDLT